MSSKTCFSRFAFFLSFNLLFSTFITTTCLSLTLPKVQPNLGWRSANRPGPVLPPSTVDGKCSKDVIKIGICAKLLNNDLLKVLLGKPPVTPCCSLIQGVADVEAGICLCTAIKASVLGIDIPKIPISLRLLLNNCGGKVPSGFQCP